VKDTAELALPLRKALATVDKAERAQPQPPWSSRCSVLDVSRTTGVPTIFGVLTTETMEQVRHSTLPGFRVCDGVGKRCMLEPVCRTGCDSGVGSPEGPWQRVCAIQRATAEKAC
jgi:hypothetical protein